MISNKNTSLNLGIAQMHFQVANFKLLPYKWKLHDLPYEDLDKIFYQFKNISKQMLILSYLKISELISIKPLYHVLQQ